MPMGKSPDPIAVAMRVAGAHFGVGVAELRSQRRTRDIHAARTWGMYLAHAGGGASEEDIAARFNRDCTIVRAVLRGRTRQVKEDAASARLFAALAARCAGV